MVYTIIYKDRSDNRMGTFTFVAQKHDKNYAWAEFKKKYATCSQEPIAMIPGQAMIYFNDNIIPMEIESEAS